MECDLITALNDIIYNNIFIKLIIKHIRLAQNKLNLKHYEMDSLSKFQRNEKKCKAIMYVFDTTQ